MKIHLSLAEINAYDPHEGRRRLCPLCGDSKPRDSAHRSLSFDDQTGLWKCFRCGEAGRLREYWEQKDDFAPPRQRARARLRETFALPVKTSQSVENAVLSLPVAVSPQSGALGALKALNDVSGGWPGLWEETGALDSTPGADYLQQRGVPLLVAQAAEVRFSRSWFKQAAVVFPIKNRQGEIVAAQGRGVHGAAKLTLGPKRNGVFFAPALKSHSAAPDDVFHPLQAAIPAIILTEAPIDALSLAACGFPALALCGTSGPDWLHIACGLRRVLLAFDADEAGDEAAVTIQGQLQSFGAKCSRLMPPQGKDWNESLMMFGNAALADWLTEKILLQDEL